MTSKVPFLSHGFCRKGWLPAAIALLAFVGLSQNTFAQRPQGIDVSSFQSNNISWSGVKSQGVTWAFVKAAEGNPAFGYHTDADFTINEANAKAAGVLISYYYYCHPEWDLGTAGADTEASIFWNVIQPYTKADGLTMWPMLDFEQDVTSANPAYTTGTLSAWLNEWCNDIVNDGKAAQLTLKPIVYTFPSYADGTGGYGPGVDSSVTGWPLNMANVNFTYAQSESSAPYTTYPWSTWNFWQYNWYGTIPTTTGTTGSDLDVFNGTTSGLNAYLVTPTGPTITTQPLSVTVNAGSNATLSVTSANATSYQWKFNGANISGATNSNYTITNVQFANVGQYTVLLTNSGGSTFSSQAILSVLGPLTNSPGAIVAPMNMVNWWPADYNCFDIFGSVTGIPRGNFYFTQGKNGEAFHFDGSTTAISNNAPDITPPWTACMWVNYSHTPASSAGLLEDGTYALKLEQYGSSTHNVGISQIGYADSAFNFVVPPGLWTHLAFVGTTSNVTLYANGISKGSITTNGMPLPRAYIGAGYVASRGGYIDYMLGSLDDLMIFNRALSSTEINAIYHAGTGSLIRAPSILGGQLTTNHSFNLNLEGLTGKNYSLYVSTNLNSPTWTSVGALANPNGTNTYVVPNISKYQQIYFKVSQPY